MYFPASAFTIYAYTLDGGVYCLDCANSGDASLHGAPVYSFDTVAFTGLLCESCHDTIEGVS